MTDALIFDTPASIRTFQLLAVKHAICLEAKGLRHSSGRSTKAAWARHYGLPVRCHALLVLERIDVEIAALRGSEGLGS